jgi:hypothetical protein
MASARGVGSGGYVSLAERDRRELESMRKQLVETAEALKRKKEQKQADALAEREARRVKSKLSNQVSLRARASGSGVNVSATSASVFGNRLDNGVAARQPAVCRVEDEKRVETQVNGAGSADTVGRDVEAEVEVGDGRGADSSRGTAAASSVGTSPESGNELDAEHVFDEILMELVAGRGEVRASVAAHTEAVWGAHKDLEAARKRLMEEAAALVVSGLKSSTRSSYRSGCRTYEHFCKVFGFTPYALTDEQLTMFVAFSLKRVRVSSVEQYLKAIRSACVDMGVVAPPVSELPRLQRALQGARYAEKACAPDGSYRLPITLPMLKQMVAVVLERAGVAEREGKVVEVGSGLGDPFQRVAMYLTAFFGALRPGELTVRKFADGQTSTELRMRHMRRQEVENPYSGKQMAMWTLFLESSKTDPLGTRSDIVIGESGAALCAVKALDLYLRKRLDAGHELQNPEALVFPGGKDGKVSVLYTDFLAAVRQDLTEAGYDVSKYAAHSFRIGCATTLATNGVPDHMIQAIGRWNSDCYKRYIRVEPQQRAMLAAYLQSSDMQSDDLHLWSLRVGALSASSLHR